MSVLVLEQAFEVREQYEQVLSNSPGAALVAFTGYVRDICDYGVVEALELEHYPGMTEKVLDDIGMAAAQRFSLLGWRIVHRFGVLQESEPIVWVGVAAAHRGEAFAGCQFIMDTLKTRAPFWKKEHLKEGGAIWVASKEQDEQREREWRDSTL